ncbi:centrosomal protein of 63 kDa-like isoform X2 [Acipenser ruthenus]|uniref:centrosomal protein of 63 kDa-like isoform X2 n=1 Tax=Acipenser ruthenus TaxID=7906 RepID=UPI00274120E4|nr:centrosomal protein of 63 kDa-like isoform X2 [Acipenser ruthenus]
MDPLVEGVAQRDLQGIIPCEAELQELMHQIDIMVSHKRCEWERQRQTLEARLEVREQELLNTRYSFNSKNQEVGRLHHLLEEMDKSNKATVQKYEEQLNGLQSELGKLKSSYKKLQRHHIRQARETSKETEEEDSLFETSKLNRKLEEFRAKAKEWEKQRAVYQTSLTSLESHRRSLADKCELFQSQLSNRVALQEEAEQKRQCEVRQLRSELETAQKTLLSSEVTIDQLRNDVQELTSRSREHLEETQRLLQDLRQSHTQRQKMEEELSELRQELHTRDDLLKAADLEEKQLRREGAKLREQLTKQVSAIRMEEQSSKNMMATEMLNLKVDLESTCQQLQASQNKEQILRAEMTRLQSGLEASHSHCMQLKDCLRRTEKEVHRLKAVEEDKNNEIIKLRDRVLQLEESHRLHNGGLQAELTNLAAKLEQREFALQTAVERTSSHENELKQSKGKPTDYQVAKIQLEALNLENKHLKELIATMEAKTDMQTLGNSLKELWGNIPATSYAEKQNKTLQKDQVLLQAELDTPSLATQGKHSVEQGAMERREQEDREDTGHQKENENERKIATSLKSKLNQESILRKEEGEIGSIPTWSATALDSNSRHSHTCRPTDRPSRNLAMKESILCERQSPAVGVPSLHGNSFIDEELPDVYMLGNPQGSLESEEEFMLLSPCRSSTAAEWFLQEEEKQSKELERLFDIYVAKLNSNTQQALQKHTVPKLS